MTLAAQLSSVVLPRSEHPVAGSSWAAVSFAANISDWNATYIPTSYMKDNYKRVHIRGICKTTSTATTQTLFTLPSGFRPAELTICLDLNWTAAKGGQFGRVDISTAGVVSVQVYNTVASGDSFNLDGINFRAA